MSTSGGSRFSSQLMGALQSFDAPCLHGDDKKEARENPANGGEGRPLGGGTQCISDNDLDLTILVKKMQ